MFVAVATALALLFGVGLGLGQAFAASITLTWDANTEPDIAGYKVYYGTASRTYGTPIDVGKVTGHTVGNLSGGKTYFVSMTAYDSFGSESGFSSEVTVSTSVPEISLAGNAVNIPNGDTTPAIEDGTDFGNVIVNGGLVSRQFEIKNNGSGTLTIGGTPRVVISGAHASDFTVTDFPVASVPSVASGASTTFKVRFDPSTAGVRVATLTIPNNDPDESPFTFAIRGTGSGASPEIHIVGNALSIAPDDFAPTTEDFTDFGSTAVVGGTVSRTFKILNRGLVPLTLTGTPLVDISGSHAAAFKLVVPPAASVAAARSTTFKVRFNPSAAGAQVATLTIASNAGNTNPYKYAIQGTGTTTAAAEDLGGKEQGAPPDEALPPASVMIETISTPLSPSGQTSLTAGVTYAFSTGGAISSKGNAVQYRFSWSDGSVSEWLPVGVLQARKSWAVEGTYANVRVEARCVLHPSVVSPSSPPLTVNVQAAETESVSRPPKPLGATTLSALSPSVFKTGGASVSSGEPVQYRFHWSDGSVSEWLPVGVTEATKSWSVPGSYAVRAEARCAQHTSIVSAPTDPLNVNISTGFVETLSEPLLPTGPGEGETGFLYAFNTGGAFSSVADPVQYRFQWGDGTTSGWITPPDAAQVNAWKFWPAEGLYSVSAEARCDVHPELMIPSGTVDVQIVRGDPAIFFDSFGGGASADASAWQVLTGDWTVNADQTFSSGDRQSDNIAIVGAVQDFRAGRLTAQLRLAKGATGKRVGLVFSHTDPDHYRYVALTDSNLYLGQVGATATELEGIKISVPKKVGLNAWYQLRVDIYPDGEVKVYFGKSPRPALAYRFADPVAGSVGCAADMSVAYFDDFGIWDERVLLP